MTQEDKELLLKDLCARLPYLPIVEISIYRDSNRKSDIELDPHVTENIWELIDKYHAIPYLRPMTSMTDKELIEFLEIRGMNLNSEELRTFREGKTSIVSTLPSYSKHIDWLNKNHFDFRGLIEKNLALDCTGLHIYD